MEQIVIDILSGDQISIIAKIFLGFMMIGFGLYFRKLRRKSAGIESNRQEVEDLQDIREENKSNNEQISKDSESVDEFLTKEKP